MAFIWKILFRIFVGLLPWSVLISVFFGEKLGFGFVRFWKEIFLCVFIGIWFFEMARKRVRRTFDVLDYSILAYILWLICISFFQGASIQAYVFGLRYDTLFFIAFFIFRRLIPYWNISFSHIAKIFLISWGIMLIVSLLIRYVFWEMVLTVFGFSDTIGVIESVSAPPIYHDIRDSDIIRFQGVLEWPNQMASFLLVYLGVYLTALWKFRRYRFINSVGVIVLGILIFMTYSRSAYLGIWGGIVGVIIFWMWEILFFKKYKRKRASFWKKIILWAGIGILALYGASTVFLGDFYDVFTRHGSTTGHFERIEMWLTRFHMHPWWSGLAQAGPASRAVAEVNGRSVDISTLQEWPIRELATRLKAENPDFYFTTSVYHLPESWYVQQLIEWWWVAWVLFASILIMLLIQVRSYRCMMGSLLAIAIMSIFLHTFEASYVALALFTFLAFFLPVAPPWAQRFPTKQQLLKYGMQCMIFLLPWHALFMTFLQCKVHINTLGIRFWKEIGVCILFCTTLFHIKKRGFLYRSQLVFVTLFVILFTILCAFIPDTIFSVQDILALRYDSVFLLMLLVGLSFPYFVQYRNTFLKTLFVSTGLMLGVFVIWYTVFDIATMTNFFWYSSHVSTYDPRGCLAFSQNITGGYHRLQASFGWPIRLGVFLAWVYILSLWSISRIRGRYTRGGIFISFSLLLFVAVFYTYSKTAYVGIFSGLIIYMIFFLTYTEKKLWTWSTIVGIGIICGGLAFLERDFLLHPWALLVRQGNLFQTWQMFLSHPFGYGLGSAGPASYFDNNGLVRSAFLPESWYLQILIEQGIIGLLLFLFLMYVIVRELWRRMHLTRDTYSIALFSAFCSLLIMGCFTHVFEEAATSYIIFFLIGLHCIIPKVWK